MNVAEPQQDFLDAVARLARQHGALLVFDRNDHRFPATPMAGRRILRGDARPGDLRQGLANGYPVSAVAGRRDLMKLMEEILGSPSAAKPHVAGGICRHAGQS